MKTVSLSRRQVLRGTGGFTLGLPLLPSLLPGPGYGVAYAAGMQKRFVAMTTEHGGISPTNMFPAATTLTNSMTLYPGHDIRWGTLQPIVSGGRTTLSTVLSASSNVLSEKLVRKMNVLRGFDIPFYIGHHSGGHLGNYGRSDQGPKLPYRATIDQVLGYSEKFYPSLSGIKDRVVVAGQNDRGISWSWSSPTTRSGTIQVVKPQMSSNALFDRLIGGQMPSAPTAMPRKPVVDRVLANYRSLRQSNRRLSGDDRQRLDDHIDRLADLERRLGTTTPSKSCGSFTKGEDSYKYGTYPFRGNNNGKSFYRLTNDVLAAAFACGVTRVATVGILATFSDYGGSWHQDIAHMAGGAGPQQTLSTGLQQTFEFAIADLAAKLDSIEDGPGVSVLDNTLLTWTQESGPATHNAQGLTVVTFGGAAGFFKTGLFVDYRNLDPKVTYGGQNSGLLLRQWLATVLQSMGLSPADFETGGQRGYGDPHEDGKRAAVVKPEVRSRASDVVPIIKA